MLGNIAMTSEDFAGALEFYRSDARAGSGPAGCAARRRSQPHLAGPPHRGDGGGRHADRGRAVSRRRALLAGAERSASVSVRARRGPISSWRPTLLVNADVPKLAGIIAINRQEFDIARRRLEEANGRRPSDCEVGFYLQIALSEQRAWTEAADTASRAGACFDQEEAQLRKEIDELRATEKIESRRNRLIASRELRMSTNERMRAACWFNAAAAHFNVGARDQARVYAEKVLEDERFGERARELVRAVVR